MEKFNSSNFNSSKLKTNLQTNRLGSYVCTSASTISTNSYIDYNCISADIAINKGLVKTYPFKTNNGEQIKLVYMNNNQEFMIHFFNGTTETIGAKLYINNKSDDIYLILKPGERVWLERFLSEKVSNRKFKFSTYFVENNKEVNNAIRNNGEVQVQFFKLANTYNTSPYITWGNINTYPSQPIQPYFYQSSVNNSNSILNISNSGSYTGKIYIAPGSSITSGSILTAQNYDSDKKLKETGIIEEGNISNQQISKVYNYDFDYNPIKTVKFKILPISELKNEDIKKYCTNCGKKLNTKFKFCPTCGTKV